MVKLIYCIARKPEISVEEFHRYWRETHAPIAARIPGVRRYVQCHSLLQLYGGNDPGSPPVHGERIAAEYGGPVTTVIYPDGVHILNNLWYQARPLVADWLAETL